jgi:hypothetical protein
VCVISHAPILIPGRESSSLSLLLRRAPIQYTHKAKTLNPAALALLEYTRSSSMHSHGSHLDVAQSATYTLGCVRGLFSHFNGALSPSTQIKADFYTQRELLFFRNAAGEIFLHFDKLCWRAEPPPPRARASY